MPTRRSVHVVAALAFGRVAVAQTIIAGPIGNPINHHGYYLLSPTSWTQGRQAAASLGGHLATVRNERENQILSSAVLRFDGQDRRGWIGLHDPTGSGAFVWDSGEPIPYENWRAGEPRPPSAGPCVEMNSASGAWSLNLDSPHASVRLQQFAQRFYRQTCRCVVLGDSINAEAVYTNMPSGYFQRLHPQRWAGWINAGFVAGLPASTVFASPSNTTGSGIRGFGQALFGVGGPPSGGAAEANIWPCQFGDTGLWLSNPAPFDTTYGSRFPLSARSLFPGGDWFAGPGMVRIVVYRGALGESQLGTCTLRDGATVQFTGSRPLSPGYNWFDLPTGSGPSTADAWLRTASPDINEINRNLYFLGERWYIPGAGGLELSFAGVGSSKVADHINPDRVSDQAIAAMVAAYELDSVIIWLGTNDPWIDSIWGANYKALIQRWRSAITGAGRSPRFLLIAPYDVGNAGHAAIPGYLSAIARANTDVSFFNLWSEAGAHEFLSANYLRDGVHPSAAGALAFASLLDDALQKSLAGEPVPSVYPIVEVPCYANCDRSTAAPVLNLSDVVCFMTRFAARDPAANCDGSTTPPVLDFNDLICFQNAFAAGCP